jgi:hypothetical protein
MLSVLVSQIRVYIIIVNDWSFGYLVNISVSYAASFKIYTKEEFVNVFYILTSPDRTHLNDKPCLIEKMEVYA